MSSLVDDNIVQGADEAELLSLVRAMSMSSRFGLLFAQCDSISYRSVLMDQAERMLERPIRRIRVPDGSTSLLQLVSDVDDQCQAIFVYGIEDWLSSEEALQRQAFVSGLNVSRNLFPTRISCPIVIWAPSFVITAIFRAAPDFFSINSGVYPFSSAYVERPREMSRLTSITATREAAQREHELTALLNELKALPDWQQDELAEANLLNDIAQVQIDTGKYLEAVRLIRHAVEIFERVSGSDTPDTAKSLNWLAFAYRALGDLASAEGLLLRSRKILERNLSSDDPSLAKTISQLAGVYYSQGRLIEADVLYRQALAIQERILSPYSPEIAHTLGDLAVVSEDMGNILESVSLNIRSLNIREQILGPEHPETAYSLTNLAGIYFTQGRLAEAEALYRRAYTILDYVLDPHHINVGMAATNLADVLETLGRSDEAASLRARAAAIREGHLRRNNLPTSDLPPSDTESAS